MLLVVKFEHQVVCKVIWFMIVPIQCVFLSSSRVLSAQKEMILANSFREWVHVHCLYFSGISPY